MMQGDSISLCPLERRHLAATRSWANDPELMRLMDRARPVEESEHELWFNELQGQTDRAFFAIETVPDARHVGNVWLWNIDQRHRKTEVRIVIGNREHLNHGAGTEAIALISDYAFTQLDLHKVYAYVLGINPRARRAFEKAGFVLEGTLREDRRVAESYADVYFLGKLK
jgi:RimJ/RimL family protein N-acetyltransferase